MLKLFQLATLAAIVLAAAVFARPALVYVPLKVTGLAAGSAFQTDPSAALEELLTAAVNDVNSTAPKCATQCVPWLEALQPCAATTTAQETAQCFCQTQTVGLMGTCATCLSLSQDSQVLSQACSSFGGSGGGTGSATRSSGVPNGGATGGGGISSGGLPPLASAPSASPPFPTTA
ncbi:hypothetical protein JCM10213_004864 [Rhodosporidiobolus nylandii]